MAIDHAAARRPRNDAHPFEQRAERRYERAGRQPLVGSDVRGSGAARRDAAPGAPRRTRIPYADHGLPQRPRPDRAATAQHARLAQGRNATALQGGANRQRVRQAPTGSRSPQRLSRGSGPSQGLPLQTPPMGGSASALHPNAGLPGWVKAVAAVVAVVAVLWIAGKLFSCGAPQTAEQPGDEPAAPAISTSPVLETRLASYAPYTDPSPSDLAALPNSDDVTGFALSGQEGVEAPVLGQEAADALDKAMAPFLEDGFDVSFVLMDIGTGRGFARDADEPIYGASSFKGPYCAFVAETYVDSGEVAISEVSDDLFNVIVYSDNGTYERLRERFSNERLVKWLDTLGVGSNLAYDTDYPTYTARESAKLWLATYDYLERGTASSDALIGYFGGTKTSFMREGLIAVEPAEGAEDEEGAEAIVAAEPQASLGSGVSDVLASAIEKAMADEVEVLDKAGWYPRDADNIPAMVDAGIVTCNGRDYLLCVMTDMPWTEPNQETVSQLIKAVFDARYDLG